MNVVINSQDTIQMTFDLSTHLFIHVMNYHLSQEPGNMAQDTNNHSQPLLTFIHTQSFMWSAEPWLAIHSQKCQVHELSGVNARCTINKHTFDVVNKVEHWQLLGIKLRAASAQPPNHHTNYIKVSFSSYYSYTIFDHSTEYTIHRSGQT